MKLNKRHGSPGRDKIIPLLQGLHIAAGMV